eukprot:2881221-Rhodomonas_salina.2
MCSVHEENPRHGSWPGITLCLRYLMPSADLLRLLEIKYKKPHFQYNLYQECGYWYLISGSSVKWYLPMVPLYGLLEQDGGGEGEQRGAISSSPVDDDDDSDLAPPCVGARFRRLLHSQLHPMHPRVVLCAF